MIRNATPILLLLLLSFFSRANDSIIIGNRAFNQIYDIQKSLQFGHIPLVGVKFIQLEKNFTAYTHDLIKTKDRFLLKVDGTGRVYEFVAKRNDSLYIRRIDSTIFFGYNGGSFTFQHKDTLMSFGGEDIGRQMGIYVTIVKMIMSGIFYPSILKSQLLMYVCSIIKKLKKFSTYKHPIGTTEQIHTILILMSIV